MYRPEDRLMADIVTHEEIRSDAPVAAPPSEMARSAAQAAAYLKTLAHEGRLMILCHLGSGEKSVGELEELLEIRQAAVSQMLARLREEGLVRTRRDGKTIYYSLADTGTEQVIALLYQLFCDKGAAPAN
jgi:ArsR family transcriptional regulator